MEALRPAPGAAIGLLRLIARRMRQGLFVIEDRGRDRAYRSNRHHASHLKKMLSFIDRLHADALADDGCRAIGGVMLAILVMPWLRRVIGISIFELCVSTRHVHRTPRSSSSASNCSS